VENNLNIANMDCGPHGSARLSQVQGVDVQRRGVEAGVPFRAEEDCPRAILRARALA
jgi:hypothetical protein